MRERLVRGTIGGMILASLLLAGGAGPGSAAEGGVGIELNKLEAADDACRIYTVFENRGATSYDSFKIDLVLFGTDGVIARRLAVQAGPLRPSKTSVKLFDIPGLTCDRIGSVLLNDVMECQSGGTAQPDCISATEVTSRAADVKMMK